MDRRAKKSISPSPICDMALFDLGLHGCSSSPPQPSFRLSVTRNLRPMMKVCKKAISTAHNGIKVTLTRKARPSSQLVWNALR